MSHETENEHGELGRLLTASRPRPSEEFTDRLDRAVADGFPSEWVEERPSRSFADRLRRRFTGHSGRRVLLPAMAGLCGILFVAAVVIKAGESTGPESPAGPEATTAAQQMDEAGQGGAVAVDKTPPLAVSRDAAEAADGAAPLSVSGAKARKVARNAHIRLGTEPDGVQEAANRVVEVVDRYHGFVLNSDVTDGPAGRAGAEFALRIPAGSLEKAIADLSGIADLRSRSQSLTDITAPVSGAEKRLRKAGSRIQVLMAELDETTDPVERQKLENRIRAKQWIVRAARNQLKRFERRVDYAPVSVTVTTAEGDRAGDEPSRWGLSNALDDAGRILGVAAGVGVLALVVAIPVGLVVLIALAINRAWVRRARRRVLEKE